MRGEDQSGDRMAALPLHGTRQRELIQPLFGKKRALILEASRSGHRLTSLPSSSPSPHSLRIRFALSLFASISSACISPRHPLPPLSRPPPSPLVDISSSLQAFPATAADLEAGHHQTVFVSLPPAPDTLRHPVMPREDEYDYLFKGEFRLHVVPISFSRP